MPPLLCRLAQPFVFFAHCFVPLFFLLKRLYIILKRYASRQSSIQYVVYRRCCWVAHPLLLESGIPIRTNKTCLSKSLLRSIWLYLILFRLLNLCRGFARAPAANLSRSQNAKLSVVVCPSIPCVSHH